MPRPNRPSNDRFDTALLLSGGRNGPSSNRSVGPRGFTLALTHGGGAGIGAAGKPERRRGELRGRQLGRIREELVFPVTRSEGVGGSDARGTPTGYR